MEPDGKIAVVKVEGRLDSTTTPDFEARLQEQASLQKPLLVCNLEGCDYASSTALRAILSAARTMKRQGGAFALCGARQYVMEVLEVAGLTSIIPVFADEAAAAASLAP